MITAQEAANNVKFIDYSYFNQFVNSFNVEKKIKEASYVGCSDIAFVITRCNHCYGFIEDIIPNFQNFGYDVHFQITPSGTKRLVLS